MRIPSLPAPLKAVVYLARHVLLDDLAPRIMVLVNKVYESNAIRDLIKRRVRPPTSCQRPTCAEICF